MEFEKFLQRDVFTKADLIRMLSCSQEEEILLFQKAAEIKEASIGNFVFGRALLELSNRCSKDCYYCGIRKSNHHVGRYLMKYEEVEKAVDLAVESGIGSMAIQSGEHTSPAFIKYIGRILHYIQLKSKGKMAVTLSCGEQSRETYKYWLEQGAHRYLLRIETSNKQLYYQLHPEDEMHNFEHRIHCLKTLKELGYQTGTGIMTGLPYQSIGDLADDLLFMKNLDIDMCGMGPFIPCEGTPLENFQLKTDEVFNITLRFIASLRILMHDINIVASTAVETMMPKGRTKALSVGANVVMPNLTPLQYRDDYALYKNKPKKAILNVDKIISDLESTLPENHTVGIQSTGTAPHFLKKKPAN